MYGGEVPPEARHFADSVAASGGSPLLVAVHDWDGARVLGLIHLRDVVKDHIRERFDELRRMDIRTVMVTGDNPLTARAIAEEAGVDDYLADVGVAMNTGTSAAEEAGNMVDLDSNPTKLVELVEIGKQLLITRDWST